MPQTDTGHEQRFSVLQDAEAGTVCARPLEKPSSGPPIPSANATLVMLELLDLQPSDILMEIGTGSGTQTKMWQNCCKEVHTIELRREYRIREADALGPHVYFSYGDGAKGLPDVAPFDAIVVTCGVSEIPDAWKYQLKDGGRLVVPLGTAGCQKLTQFIKKDGHLKPIRVAAYTRFVMMEKE